MSKPFKSELDCYMTDKMICPYCYKELEDETYYIVRNVDNTIEHTCEYCDKRFWVYAQIDIHYTTTKMDKDDSEITEWYDDEEDYE